VNPNLCVNGTHLLDEWSGSLRIQKDQDLPQTAYLICPDYVK